MKKLAKKFSHKLDKPKKDRAEDLGSPLEVFFFAIAIFFASQIVAAVVAGIFFSLTSKRDATDLFEQAGPQFLFVLIAEALATWFVYLIVTKRNKVSLAAIGLGRLPGWKDLKAGLFGFGVYYVFLIIILGVAAWLIPALDLDQEQSVGFEHIKTGFDRFFAFTSLVLLAPIGEEVVMRGYLYSGLRARMKYLPALLITSLVFGVAHLEFGSGTPLVWAAALTTFILSVVLVHQREKTGAIYAGIMIHMLNNLVAYIVTF